ncbi:hypothetical protein [Sulfurimonas indica]|uniref:hypothetical protein n=1 Tax=Sulfurimonas TaxID=202746 RepID=UPI00165F5CC2|nr:hypothetical protein [Sulfurimonas indica]
MTDFIRNLMLEEYAKKDFKDFSKEGLQWFLTNYNLTPEMKLKIEKALITLKN